MKRIRFAYLSKNPYGGWVTFMYHLKEALETQMYDVDVVKISKKRTEEKHRNLTDDLAYRNMIKEEVFDIGVDRVIITAVNKHYAEEAHYLYEQGAFLVVHDPNELKYWEDEGLAINNPSTIVIRESMLAYLPNATFIRHPYKRVFTDRTAELGPSREGAISIARIDHDKNTHLILQANQDFGANIVIKGFENRLYGKFNLMKKFPWWEQMQSTHAFPKQARMGAMLCQPFNFMVDMSTIKGDGGGTQYTFLEAWDGGAIPVINTKWFREGTNDMVLGDNCYSAETAEEITDVIGCERETHVVQQGYKKLREHDPEVIGAEYARLID